MIDDKGKEVTVKELCKPDTCALDGCAKRFTIALGDIYQNWRLPIVISGALTLVIIIAAVVWVIVELSQDCSKRKSARRRRYDAVPLQPKE